MELTITEKSWVHTHTPLMGYAFPLSPITSVCNNIAAFIAQNGRDKIHKTSIKKPSKKCSSGWQTLYSLSRVVLFHPWLVSPTIHSWSHLVNSSILILLACRIHKGSFFFCAVAAWSLLQRYCIEWPMLWSFRITQQLKLQETSSGHFINSPWSRATRAGCPGPCPDSF